MGSGKKTTTDTSSHQVETPSVPDWFSNPTQQQAGVVGGLIGQGPAAYTPGISALQKQATDAASGLSSTPSPYYQQAADQLGGVGNVSADQVKGESLLDNLSAYYNPFKDQITNPVLADYDQQSGQTRAAQAAAAAQGGAFGGSRYGVQEAQTEGNLARGRAATEGGLLSQMFTESTGLSGQDAARRQAAATANQAANLQAAQGNQSAGLSKAGILAGLGSSSGGDERANIALKASLGGAATDAENAIKQYPLTYAAQTEGLLGGLNAGLFTGHTTDSTGHSTQTQDPGLLDYLGSAAQIGSLFVPGGGIGAAMSKAAGGAFAGGNYNGSYMPSLPSGGFTMR
jgi:hypothetical protein